MKRNPDISFPKRKVIYNACESVEEVDMSGKEKVIVMAAYFCENKAPDVLLKAWKMICRDYPDWRVVMMGNGEVERYRTMAVELGVADSGLHGIYPWRGKGDTAEEGCDILYVFVQGGIPYGGIRGVDVRYLRGDNAGRRAA